MAYTYGLAGVASVLTTGAVGTGNYPVRVFDVCKVGTLGACVLYSGTVVDAAKAYINLDGPVTVFNSNAGLRFPEGLFVSCTASGATCFVNYIEER